VLFVFFAYCSGTADTETNACCSADKTCKRSCLALFRAILIPNGYAGFFSHPQELEAIAKARLTRSVVRDSVIAVLGREVGIADDCCN
jgi:hypothetical protein